MTNAPDLTAGAVHRPDPPRPQPGHRASSPHKSAARVTDITKMTIWGNHSATQYPDLFHAEIKRQERVRRRRRRPGLARARLHPHGPRIAAGPSSRRAASRRRRPRRQRRDRPRSRLVARHRRRVTGCRWGSVRRQLRRPRGDHHVSFPGDLPTTASTRSSRASTSTTSAGPHRCQRPTSWSRSALRVQELGLI